MSCVSKGVLVYLRHALISSGPKVRLGTNCGRAEGQLRSGRRRLAEHDSARLAEAGDLRRAMPAARRGGRPGLGRVLGLGLGFGLGRWAHVAVHDVELDPVDAGILEPLALGAHVGPVGGEDLRCWDAVV